MDNNADRPEPTDWTGNANQQRESHENIVLTVAAQLVGRRGGAVEPLSDSTKSGFAVRLDDQRSMDVEINSTQDLELESFASFLDMLVEELQYFNRITVSRVQLSGQEFDPRDPDSMQIDEPTASIVLPADMFSRAKSQPFARSIDTLSLLSHVDQDPSGTLNRYVVDIAMASLARHQHGDTRNGPKPALVARERDIGSRILHRTGGVVQCQELSALARNGLDAKYFWPLVYVVGRLQPGVDDDADAYARVLRSSVALRQLRPVMPVDFPFD